MTQPFCARALLGSEEALMEAQRLRIRGVFQADRVGSLPTEETGSSAVYAGIPVLDSTVFTHPDSSPVWIPIYPKTCCLSPYSGCMQDGTALGDVQLPPWADGDPRKFISLHRQVSCVGSRQSPWYPE